MVVDLLLSSLANISRTALYVLIFISTLSYLIFKNRRNSRLVKFAQELPGSDGLPLVGNSLQFVFSAPEKVFSHYSETYGSVYKLWLGKELIVGISDVNYIETIFRSTKTIEKPKVIFHGLREFWRNSLFTASKPLWKITHRRLTPFFVKNVAKIQVPSINETVDKYINCMKSHLEGAEFEIKEYLVYLAPDAFLSSYFDVHLTLKQNHYFSLHDILNFQATVGFLKMIYPWMRMKIFSKLYFSKTMAENKYKLQELFAMIKDTVNAKTIEGSCDNKAMTTVDELAKSFIAVLQQLEEETQVKNYSFEEAMLMTAASSDTTATTLSAFFLTVASHQEIQNKLYDELYNVFGDSDEPATIEDLEKLKYLDQAIKETQRIFTLVPYIIRDVEEDLKIGQMNIPAGTTIIVRARDVHMNPDLYPNPEKFNPENFNSEAVSKRSKYAFLAFGGGPRECIGKIFAEVNLKLIAVKLLRNFKFNTTTQTEKDLNFIDGIMSEKIGGYWVSITSRK